MNPTPAQTPDIPAPRPSWRRRLPRLHRLASPACAYSLAILEQDQDQLRASLSGRLCLAEFTRLQSDFLGLVHSAPARLSLDLGGVTYLDSAGALLLTWLEQQASEQGKALSLDNLAPAFAGIKNLIDPAELAKPPLAPPPQPSGLVEQMGAGWLATQQDFYQTVSFLGDFLGAVGRSFLHPRQVRWSEVFLYMEQVGVNGLPIVALISFLLGLIMAFMSSLQLQPFGANIYVANLVAVAMVKELGPIMTAILVAGRSGSAFAAEIGTMKVNEEVDALVIMGYDPLIFLALPKVLAAVLVVPLLTIFSDLVAIMGGLTVGVLGMGITAHGYIQQTAKTLYATDILTGALKSAVFAVLIAGIGCQRGFMVRGGAQAVGQATTSAVVAAMFLIIVADSIFAIVLHYWT